MKKFLLFWSKVCKVWLNRDPAQFESVRFLVDGSHWSSMKKFRKSDERQSGHLGYYLIYININPMQKNSYLKQHQEIFLFSHCSLQTTIGLIWSGCSSGYNFNRYKQHVSGGVDGAKNSQSREQMHVTLDKLGKSLKQKNYYNFFRYMNCFFAIHNLMTMKKI